MKKFIIKYQASEGSEDGDESLVSSTSKIKKTNMKKLRIAVLASNFIRIPPRSKDIPSQCSGAPEMMIHRITEELVKRGHDVTLFASGDSKTKGKLISVTKKATGVDPKIGFIHGFSLPKIGYIPSSRFHEPYEYLLISKAYQLAKEGCFDVVHSHFDISTAYFAPLVKIPTVSTLHSPLKGTRAKILSYFKNSQYYVSISNSQRKPLPDLNYIATIYHGLDLKKIPFGKFSENYLVFTGRIHPSKGVREAILVAKKLKIPLILMGSHGNESYWEEKIKPEIDGRKIIYKGFVEQKEMYKIIKKAIAYILPLQWEEPFGLTMIEAMACGTPVVTFDRGSAKEVVKDGKTGFVVKNVSEMVKAIKKIDEIKRENCRAWVEKKFTIEKMVDDYEKIYYQISSFRRKRR